MQSVLDQLPDHIDQIASGMYGVPAQVAVQSAMASAFKFIEANNESYGMCCKTATQTRTAGARERSLKT